MPSLQDATSILPSPVPWTILEHCVAGRNRSVNKSYSFLQPVSGKRYPETVYASHGTCLFIGGCQKQNELGACKNLTTRRLQDLWNLVKLRRLSFVFRPVIETCLLKNEFDRVHHLVNCRIFWKCQTDLFNKVLMRVLPVRFSNPVESFVVKDVYDWIWKKKRSYCIYRSTKMSIP